VTRWVIALQTKGVQSFRPLRERDKKRRPQLIERWLVALNASTQTLTRRGEGDRAAKLRDDSRHLDSLEHRMRWMGESEELKMSSNCARQCRRMQIKNELRD
jgi:hypothetical protein